MIYTLFTRSVKLRRLLSTDKLDLSVILMTQPIWETPDFIDHHYQDVLDIAIEVGTVLLPYEVRVPDSIITGEKFQWSVRVSKYAFDDEEQFELFGGLLHLMWQERVEMILKSLKSQPTLSLEHLTQLGELFQ